MIRRSIGLSIGILLSLCLLGCGGSGGNTPATPATTIVTLSDPVTCGSSASGPFSHVYVTISDVQIHASSSAGPNDPGWVDLTPNLKNAPQQVDLLGLPHDGCFLANLGSTTQLQPGTYQQMRVVLADNTFRRSGTDPCNGVAANCVVLSTDVLGANPVALELSSESRTGMKIPSGQMAGGQFTIAAGQTKDLNIDFDACASIVMQSAGQFRLKPVLHAGEVSLTDSTAVTGTVVDKATGQPLVGGKSIVALEQKDSSGVARMIMQITPDASGNFNLCPVPAGTYDLVAVGVNGAGVAYAATITTGVGPGKNVGKVPLIAVTGASTQPASLTGTVTTAKAGPAATIADIILSALQQVGTTTYTIPLAQQSSATATLVTAAAGTCPANTDCANYTLSLPPANPTIGAFAATGITYTASTDTVVNYKVEAHAFVPGEGSVDDCTPPIATSAAVTVTAGASVPVAALNLTGCQ
jgi:Domain of unknown function (DUF4382)